MIKKTSVFITSLSLLAILSLIIYAKTLPEPQITFTQSIANILPQDLEGWTVKELALSETELYSKSAENQLNFDDYKYLQYNKDGYTFTIYMAYWKPGKMSVRDVQSHTPDRCWTKAGMKIKEHEIAQSLKINNIDMLPVEWRVFSDKWNNTSYVYFWHIVGDKVKTMDRIYNRFVPFIERAKATFTNYFLSFDLNQEKEQLFIRVVSNVSFDKLWAEPGFTKFMEHIAPYCMDKKHK